MTILASLIPLAAALIALSGVLWVSTRQVQDAAQARAEVRKDALDLERRRHYVALLTAGRQLRDIPLRHFQGRPQDVDADPIIVEVYRALYSIKITAPKHVADLAQDFKDAAVAFWRLSRDEPQAPEAMWRARRAEVKRRVQAFRAAVRKDFGESLGQDLGELDYDEPASADPPTRARTSGKI